MKLSLALTTIAALAGVFVAFVQASPALQQRSNVGEIDEQPMVQAVTCTPCPENGVAGDNRCTIQLSLYPVKQGSKATTEKVPSCPDCGCQTCPDEKVYDREVTDYCQATPSTKCSQINLLNICKFTCPADYFHCQTLEWDRTSGGCGCGCQKCADNQYYGPTSNYLTAKPLTDTELQKCPHIKHPKKEPVDLCSYQS